MAHTDPRVDEYISKAAPFARPILTRIRRAVHRGCPEVTEGIKWGAPFFDYKGIFCGMAAFKAHATFGFWNGRFLPEDHLPKASDGGKSIARFGKIRSVDELPGDAVLVNLVRMAAKIQDEGRKAPRPPRPRKPPVKTPSFFLAALTKNKKALAAFEAFPPSHKREYIEWVTGAKLAETRERRLSQAVAMIAEGKSRNWKYET